jgi:glyceraldehyde 3-phosphate dehydrogenase
MTPLRIGINGFGRIGRLALRAAWDWPDVEFVQVNEVAGDAATGAHLLCFDSVHGRWDHAVEGTAGQLLIDGHPVAWSTAKLPVDVVWDVD